MNVHKMLYEEGVKRCKKFLQLNKLPLPRFITYAECEKALAAAGEAMVRPSMPNHRYDDAMHDVRLVRHIKAGATVGMASGFYHRHPSFGPTVYVNLDKTAAPVFNPGYRSWSYPCWKTDRTAMGVVAHEVGHHVAEYVSQRFTAGERAELREDWARAVKGKKVSGYEPTLDEAAAETLRLFILNPSLLRAALPKRWSHMTGNLGLKHSERADWRVLLKGAEPYIIAAERWIG